MASQEPKTTATSASGVTTEPKSGEAGSRPSIGQAISMSGKRKSPEAGDVVPSTPREVHESVTDITVKPPRERVPKLNAEFWARFPYDIPSDYGLNLSARRICVIKIQMQLTEYYENNWKRHCFDERSYSAISRTSVKA